MNNLYRGPPIYASYQISVHLATRFQRRRFFRNRPIRNKNCLWWPCLLTYGDEMSNLYRGPSIDASYQVSVHLAKGFQMRRLKCKTLTDDGWQMTDDGRHVMEKNRFSPGFLSIRSKPKGYQIQILDILYQVILKCITNKMYLLTWELYHHEIILKCSLYLHLKIDPYIYKRSVLL
jgi:hypothetical protein